MQAQLPSGVRAPLQARSRKTFDDILKATEALMNTKSWVDITVMDIVNAANCTVGSFYARFDDKNAVLVCLSEQLSKDVEDDSASYESLSASSSIEQVVTQLVDQLTDVYQRRIGLIRTLTLLPRLNRDQSLQGDGLRTARVFRGLVDMFVALGASRECAEVGLFFVVNAIRERVLFSEISKHMIDVEYDRFSRGLVIAFISYLDSESFSGDSA